MSIRRSADRPNDHFTIVGNDFARDGRLSFKARGIALYLLSHSAGFTATTESIARNADCGLDLVRTGLRELEEHGYLHRERARTDGGHLGSTDYVITDHIPAGQNQSRIIQRRETQRREIPTHKKTNPKEDQKTEEVTPSPTADAAGSAQPDTDLALPGMPPAPVKASSKPSRDEADAGFAQWWTAYPRKVEKRAARKAWDKALREHRTDRETLILEAKRYADVVAGSRFIKHPATWLNGDCWLDELVTPSDLIALSNKHTPYSDDPNADYTGAMT